MISYYFGKPGCGKSTYLTFLALRENDRINKGKSKYKRVFVNVASLRCPRDVENNIYLFQDSDFGVFDMSNSLILWDEASFSFDKVDYKSLASHVKKEIMLHRHKNMELVFFNQLYSGLNNKIRQICNRTFELRKSFNGTIRPYVVSYDLHIPKKPKLKDLDKLENSLGEVKEYYYRHGYFYNAFSTLFFPMVKGRKVWRFFDSYESEKLPFKVFKKVEVI